MRFAFVLLFTLNVCANNCSPYYNPNKFYEAPQALIEFLEDDIGIEKLFFNIPKTDNFNQRIPNHFIYKDLTYQNKLYYPKSTGIWQFKLLNNQMDELHIARVEIYRFADEAIAQNINDEFENYWNDFVEDGYSMQLTPEQTLFRYNDEYFSFSVFIYGVKGDATPLKGTVVDFYFKNYTNEVNDFITCNKEDNGSR